MAAIRSKLEVALLLPGVQLAPRGHLSRVPADGAHAAAGGDPRAAAAKRGGRLLEGAAREPGRNADHRCFMWCVLAHCLGVDKLTKEQRWKAATCSSSTPSRPAAPGAALLAGSPLWPMRGWTSPACLLTAQWALRTSTPLSAGTPAEWRSSSSRGSAPSGRTGRSTSTSCSSGPRPTRAPPSTRRAHPEEHLLWYKPKASAELAPLVCYADLEVYSTPAPSVHVAQAQPARQTTVASSCYVAVGRCGYEPPGRALPAVEAAVPAGVLDPRGGAGPRARPSLQGVPEVVRGRCEEAPPLPRHRAVPRGAVPLLQHRGPDAQERAGGLPQRGRLRLPLPAALHRVSGLSGPPRAAKRRAPAATPTATLRTRTAAPRMRRSPRPRPRPRPRPEPLLARSAGRAPAEGLQPPEAVGALQVGREVPAALLGPAEVRGQHERLPDIPGQHDRRPPGLRRRLQVPAGALPADGLAPPRAAEALRALAAHHAAPSPCGGGVRRRPAASRAPVQGSRSQARAHVAEDPLLQEQAGAGVGLPAAQAAHALQPLQRP